MKTELEDDIQRARKKLVDVLYSVRKSIWSDERLSKLIPYPIYSLNKKYRTVQLANFIKVKVLKSGALRVIKISKDVPDSVISESVEGLLNSWNSHIRIDYFNQLRAALDGNLSKIQCDWLDVHEAFMELDSLLQKAELTWPDYTPSPQQIDEVSYQRKQTVFDWLIKRCPFYPDKIAGIANIGAMSKLFRIEVAKLIESAPEAKQVRISFQWLTGVKCLNIETWNRIVEIAPFFCALREDNKRLAIPYIAAHGLDWLHRGGNRPPCFSRPVDEAISSWRRSLIKLGLTPAAWRWMTHLTTPQWMALVTNYSCDDGSKYGDIEFSGRWSKFIPILNHIVQRQLPAQSMIKWIKMNWVPQDITDPRINALYESAIRYRHLHRREIGSGKKRIQFDREMHHQICQIHDYLNCRDASNPYDAELLEELGVIWPQHAFIKEGSAIDVPCNVGFNWFVRRSKVWHKRMAPVWEEVHHIRCLVENYYNKQSFKNEEARKKHLERFAWSSAINVTTIGEYQVIPLCSAIALAEEGCEMHHCVGSYVDNCVHYGHRIFSIRLNGFRLATLEIAPNRQFDASFFVRQVSGIQNNEVPQPIVAISNQVADLYSQALKIENMKVI